MSTKPFLSREELVQGYQDRQREECNKHSNVEEKFEDEHHRLLLTLYVYII